MVDYALVGVVTLPAAEGGKKLELSTNAPILLQHHFGPEKVALVLTMASRELLQ